jgi:hypothetical protein
MQNDGAATGLNGCNGAAPLFYLAQCANPGAVCILVEAGADVDSWSVGRGGDCYRTGQVTGATIRPLGEYGMRKEEIGVDWCIILQSVRCKITRCYRRYQ